MTQADLILRLVEMLLEKDYNKERQRAEENKKSKD